MNIIHEAHIGGLALYVLRKVFTDDETEEMTSKYVDTVKLVINDDSDVYDENGKILARFRKAVIPLDEQTSFYNALGKHLHHIGQLRGIATATELTEEQRKECKTISRASAITKFNGKCKSNIFGYFDTFTPHTKRLMGKTVWKPYARICAWNRKNPEKYQQTLPLIKQVDRLYAKLQPDKYSKQREKADAIFMKIEDTAFTTITTNINFRTALHTDKGDDIDGFGNLSVIEYGSYTGGETCLYQYGVGFNVRGGDILLMDVHQLHGNLPLNLEGDAIRCSIVCYLRAGLWKNTKGMTKEECDAYIQRVQSLGKKSICNVDGLRDCNTDLQALRVIDDEDFGDAKA